MENIYLALCRILLYAALYYLCLILVETALNSKPLRLALRVLVSIFNSLISTYMLLNLSFLITYPLLFLVLLLEFVIIYRKNVAKLICVAEIFVLSEICLRGVSVSIFALAYGVSIGHIIESTPLLYITSILPCFVIIPMIFVILRHMSMLNIQLPLRHTVQRRYLLFWLTVYNLFMLVSSGVYSSGSNISFVVYDYLCRCIFVLLCFCTLPSYLLRLNRTIETQKKNRSLSLELGNQKQLQSALTQGAIFTAEANLTKNRIIRGLEVYSDSPEHIGKIYDAWFDFVETKIHPGDYSVFRKSLSRQNLLDYYNCGVEPMPFEYRRLDDNGKYYWVRLIIQIFKDAESEDIMVFGYAFNIEKEKREKQDLILRAQTDLFTGLYNKSTTEALIGEEIAKRTGILLLLDVDDFKNVNDQLGHEVGDHVLKQIADVLKSSSREDDILGRVGGDEFLIFLKDTTNMLIAEQRAAEILSQLNAKSDYSSNNRSITASIGIAVIDDKVRNFSDAYNRADSAMYRVKRSKKNGYSVYGTFNQGEVVS